MADEEIINSLRQRIAALEQERNRYKDNWQQSDMERREEFARGVEDGIERVRSQARSVKAGSISVEAACNRAIDAFQADLLALVDHMNLLSNDADFGDVREYPSEYLDMLRSSITRHLKNQEQTNAE